MQSNLINSYYQLLQFANKHLLDKFYLEKDISVNLRGIIVREMLVNTLMHREYTSSFYSKFVIEKERMYTENANRAIDGKLINPNEFEPLSKNPIIANFFRNIGFVDELGSGTRRLYHYVPIYSGNPPEMIDGDIFRQIIPLDDEYSFDVKVLNSLEKNTVGYKDYLIEINNTQKEILKLMISNPTITAGQLSDLIGISKRQIEVNISKLKALDAIWRDGAKKNGRWVVKDIIEINLALESI